MNKITIIGSGAVGSTIAYTLTTLGLASEIVIIDINGEKALGEALDIRQGTPFCSPCNIYAGLYCDAVDSDIVIITCGIARKPGQSRLDLAQTNVNIMKDIAPKIAAVAPNALYVIVSNPVDIMTYVFTKISGLPENQIIGSGTILDTSRLQSELAKRFHISPKNVHAHVYGEHGDSQFVPWSLAHIANNHVDAYRDSSPDKDLIDWEGNYQEVEEFVRKSGSRIIENKGATFFAVAMSVCHICKCIYANAGTAVTVSTMMHGEYGVDDVCMSTLALVGPDGYKGKVLVELTDEEVEKMKASAEALKSVISQIEI